MLAYGGRSVAAGTPTAVARRVKELFTLLEQARGKAPPSKIAGVKRMPRVQPANDPRPISQPPNGTIPVPEGNSMYQLDLATSKKNLIELAKRRVAGQISDQEYYQHCATYCIGISEDICMDYLDATMENAPPPWVPGDDVQSLSDQVQAAQHTTNGVMVGASVPSNLIENVRPQDLVDDFITDDTTGEVLTDGR